MWIQNVTELMIYKQYVAAPAETHNGKKEEEVVQILLLFLWRLL